MRAAKSFFHLSPFSHVYTSLFTHNLRVCFSGFSCVRYVAFLFAALLSFYKFLALCGGGGGGDICMPS